MAESGVKEELRQAWELGLSISCRAVCMARVEPEASTMVLKGPHCGQG